ncbi:c-type cytochrome [Thalassoroseus pseudoceratinae]|uniref:c-type cytochrome n=1 Tax=Thalassoroseus pseudoceratinae TaxID=2713176 RepID=UPI00141F588D|nr:cytochrome c [Thalassoroseus pseudoceratinae]
MSIWIRIRSGLALLVLVGCVGFMMQTPTDVVGQDDDPKKSESSSDMSKIERGKYLATEVAMCVQCHSPRRSNGEIDSRKLFEGAPVPVASPYRSTQWAFHAPSIAGLPGGWSEADLVMLLTTAKRPRGPKPDAPMPPYKMTVEDASAIAAYLNSLE